MKWIFALICSTAIWTHAFARLGDTQDRAENRYGLPKKPHRFVVVSPLIEGAKELNFEFAGWKIRCALLLATDGKEYVVREEYRKIWNGEVMKAKGTLQIRDFERDALLKGEAGSGTWREKMVGDLVRDPVHTMTNQFLHLSGLSGKVWTREDGAIARDPVGDISMILDLPQARKYEEELKAIKDQKAKAAVPKF